MASPKRTTPVDTQQTISRPQSNLDWNAPRKPITPRSEYRFMRDFTMVWLQSPNGGSFGPFDGGVSL
jgi:hypothetical protein